MGQHNQRDRAESNIKREVEVQEAKRETKDYQAGRGRSNKCNKTWSPRASWMRAITRKQGINLGQL